MSFADLSKTQRDEFAASLAVLALFDAGVEVTADALTKAFQASGNDVAAYVAPLFADLLARGLDVEKFLAGPSAGTNTVFTGITTVKNRTELTVYRIIIFFFLPPGAAPAAGGAPAGEAATKVEEKAVEEEEEVDMGGGMDMFGGDEDY
ncbi:unnamed protein product [Phytophthora fragariaefolia]|uniref:Unnamed protein product n=1 Tax=Phytophthora fragariaefolia TaxID=1490495 RepID=A0A9W6XET3_9STRA|nr:unnamed protein product [Phytophthora fragariaefolia]